MKHLKRLSRHHLAEVGTPIVVAFLVVALLGFADSAFLAVEHFLGVVPPCTTDGCEIVLTSPYSLVFGIPVSLLGALYYLVIALGAFMYLEARHGKGAIAAHHSAILKWTFVATFAGLIVSLYFTYLQAFVIDAWCLYCLGSAATSTALFVIGFIALRKHLREPMDSETL